MKTIGIEFFPINSICLLESLNDRNMTLNFDEGIFTTDDIGTKELIVTYPAEIADACGGYLLRFELLWKKWERALKK